MAKRQQYYSDVLFERDLIVIFCVQVIVTCARFMVAL